MKNAPVPKNPSDIARETLLTLAASKIPPTPANYAKAYRSIAGDGSCAADFAQAEGANPPAPQAASSGASQDDPALLPKKIAEALRLLEMQTPGLSKGKKLEGLFGCLETSPGAPQLLRKLTGLVKNWKTPLQAPSASEIAIDAPEPEAEPAPAERASHATKSHAPANPPPAIPRADPELAEWAAEISSFFDPALSCQISAELARLEPAPAPAGLEKLRGLCRQTALKAREHAARSQAYLDLLSILANAAPALADDAWIAAEAQTLAGALRPGATLREIESAGAQYTELFRIQEQLKAGMAQAKSQLQSMLAAFVDKLADMAAQSGDYHDFIEQSSKEIANAKALPEISQALAKLLEKSDAMKEAALGNQNALNDMRKSAEQSRSEIEKLRVELEKANDLARHDALTGALNRKGLAEEAAKAIGACERKNRPLCVALLDLDNFKKLNDTCGHTAGDSALAHLAEVARQTLRPQDSLARYGGEEFVVILPDTDAPGAAAAMARVQRELTRRIFMHNNDRVLITFSCGVAARSQGETLEQTLARADNAMYCAKKSGKNRVEVDDPAC